MDLLDMKVVVVDRATEFLAAFALSSKEVILAKS